MREDKGEGLVFAKNMGHLVLQLVANNLLVPYHFDVDRTVTTFEIHISHVDLVAGEFPAPRRCR